MGNMNLKIQEKISKIRKTIYSGKWNNMWIPYVIGLIITIIIYPFLISDLNYKRINNYNAYITKIVPFDGEIRIISPSHIDSIVKFAETSDIVGDHDCIYKSDSSLKLVVKTIDWIKLFINSEREIELFITDNNKKDYTDVKMDLVRVTVLAVPEKLLKVLKDYGALVIIFTIALALKPLIDCK